MDIPFLSGLGAGLKASINLNPSESGLTKELPAWKVRRNPFNSIKFAKEKIEESISKTDILDNYPNEAAVIESDEVYIFQDTENISGEVVVEITPGKKAEHLGMKSLTWCSRISKNLIKSDTISYFLAFLNFLT